MRNPTGSGYPIPEGEKEALPLQVEK